MPRSKPPAPSTVEGTLRILNGIEAEDIPQELTRLRGYWPLLLDRIVERAVQLPREHFLEVIDWLLEEGIPAAAATEDPPHSWHPHVSTKVPSSSLALCSLTILCDSGNSN